MPFVPISAPRLYQVVADQIAQLIRAGEYRTGDRLPPERDLSRQLGVSRPVVRESMIALEIAGLVEVRGGSGVYVRAAAQPIQVPDAGDGPYEAFMARRAIEGEIAAAAAENATAAHLAELAAAIEQMRGATQARVAVDPGDRRFHLALAAASQNAIYTEVVRFIWDELLNRGPIWAKLRERRTVRPTRVDEHEAILRAIADRDPECARRAVHAHFDGAIRDFLEMTASEDDASDAPEPSSAAIRELVSLSREKRNAL
jgi:DNA-binding FadR family transcriptional regulator